MENLKNGKQQDDSTDLPLSDPKIFLPNGKPINLIKKWAFYLLFLLIASLFTLIRIHNLHEFTLFESINLSILVLIVCTNKAPISVSISTLTKTLVYTYTNSWAQTKYTTVELDQAGGAYKYDVSKTGGAWKLVLYNDNIFKNRISIRASTANGYSEEQLDEIVRLIHQCK